MSSTNRGRDRQANDYYVTPIPAILHFLAEFDKDRMAMGAELPQVFGSDLTILDPGAGGDVDHPPSYPTAIRQFAPRQGCKIRTIDIRDDSLAVTQADYLNFDLDYQPCLAFSNPPFELAIQFIDKCLRDVMAGGLVIMLQRLNFFGSGERFDFWKKRMPLLTYVHSKRMGFKTKKSAELSGKPFDGKTDSIEYAHFVWKKDFYPTWTKLRVI